MLIQFDNTIALLIPETDREVETYTTVRDQCKTMAPGARYMYKHKLYLRSRGKQGWDGKASILSKASIGKGGVFPSGLLPYIYDKLLLLNTPVNDIRLEDKRIEPLGTRVRSHAVPLRPYQEDALLAGLGSNFVAPDKDGIPTNIQWPRGVMKIATGGGKTELAVALYQAIQIPTLFLVHRTNLITQARRRLKKYGIDSGQIGAGKFNPNPNGITVATVQTLHSRIKKGDPKELETFIKAQQIFYDEAHMCAASLNKGNIFVQLGHKLKHAYYRWGLTATPFLLDEYSNQLLMGTTGDTLYSISNAELIELGFLTPPRVQIIKVPAVLGPKAWPECYDSAIVLNRWRNERIIDELIQAPIPAIVMCVRKSHATILANIAEEKGIPRPIIMWGDTSVKERDKTIEELNTGKRDRAISTVVFKEGVDIPELRTLILAGGGMSTVAQLQYIGRGLRIADGKDEVLVIDFKDTSSYSLKKHSRERKKVWKNEGFTIEERE